MLVRILLHLCLIPPTSIRRVPALCKEPHGVCKGCKAREGATYNQEGKETWKLSEQVGRNECGQLSRTRPWEQAGSEKCPGVWGEESANSVTDT